MNFVLLKNLNKYNILFYNFKYIYYFYYLLINNYLFLETYSTILYCSSRQITYSIYIFNLIFIYIYNLYKNLKFNLYIYI